MDKTPVTSHQIATGTRTDPVLSKVYSFVLDGWPESNTDIEILPYFKRRTELSVNQGCLLWGSRVIIPPEYQEAKLLAELHDTHPGMVKMKSLSRSYIWLPNLDQAIESTVQKCVTCQQLGNKPQKAPLNPWEWPSKPWNSLHLDYAGPFEGKMILVIIDSGTKYIDAHVMSSSTSAATVEKLHHTCALMGLPRTIVTDNGTPFTREQFETFCKMSGTKHICTSPYHPSSNGMAEKAVQSIKSALKKNTEGSLETRIYSY